MAKQTTRDAALSRLFGNAGDATPAEEHSDDAATSVIEKAPVASPSASKKKPRREHAPEIAERGGGEVEPVPEDSGAPSGYMGLGRYARVDGVVERITPYVRPDQAEALRLAAARKNDPRGTDISQIVQALLDEAGYRA